MFGKIRSYFTRHTFLLITVFTVAIFIRFYNYHAAVFSFDQVQIIDNAYKILTGDPTLIGPRTGPANMFTGPLIYYITAPFLLLFDYFFTTALVPLVIALISGVILLFVTRRYMDTTQATIIFILWAISPFIAQLDRTFWNPNLTLLAASLTYFPLVKKEKLQLFDYLLLFCGSFLGYQAHFSGFLLPVLAVLLLLIRNKKEFMAVVPIILGMSFSLLPTLLFDIRNNWLNTKGILTLLTTDSPNVYGSQWNNILTTILTSFENIGKVLVSFNSYPLIVLVGVFVVYAAVYLLRNSQKPYYRYPTFLPLVWMFAITFIYFFYSGSKPEYYYVIQVPAILHVLALLCIQVNAHFRQFVLGLLGAFSVLAALQAYSGSERELGIATIEEIKSTVTSLAQSDEVQQIAYDMPFGTTYGVEYALQDIPTAATGTKIIHISYPNQYSFVGVKEIGSSGVWTEQIDDRSATIGDWYRISYPNQFALYENSNSNKQFLDATEFVVFENEQRVGRLLAIGSIDGRKEFNVELRELYNLSQDPASWKQVELRGELGWATTQNEHMYFYQSFSDERPTLELIFTIQ